MSDDPYVHGLLDELDSMRRVGDAPRARGVLDELRRVAPEVAAKLDDAKPARKRTATPPRKRTTAAPKAGRAQR